MADKQSQTMLVVDGLQVTEEDWKAWVDSPPGRIFSLYLGRKQEELKTAWAKGAFGDLTQHETVVTNAVAQGMYRALDQILDLEFETVSEEFKDA